MTTSKEIRPGKVGEHLVPSFSLVPRLPFGEPGNEATLLRGNTANTRTKQNNTSQNIGA